MAREGALLCTSYVKEYTNASTQEYVLFRLDMEREPFMLQQQIESLHVQSADLTTMKEPQIQGYTIIPSMTTRICSMDLILITDGKVIFSWETLESDCDKKRLNCLLLPMLYLLMAENSGPFKDEHEILFNQRVGFIRMHQFNWEKSS